MEKKLSNAEFKAIETRIISRTENGKERYYVQFKIVMFFGLIKWWQYILHDTPMGIMHRPFYSMDSAKKYEQNFKQQYV